MVSAADAAASALEYKAEYNYDEVAYAVKNGVLRISVPKTAAARGEKITAVAADANINAVGLDDETDEA